jgi:5-methylcytosine-specific restriction endonuclease McrA
VTAEEIRRICARPTKSANRRARAGLLASDRVKVFRKTGGTCHVCGETLRAKWQADHVVPHRSGGSSTFENYLPICKECNRLRWFHSPEVIRLIMRLGIYAKNEIRNRSELGEQLLPLLLKRLRTNEGRRLGRKVSHVGGTTERI